jgi:methyl-accepting chemotaxis protein
VVAGEVKTLAAQTSKATSEIAAQIETVRAATQDAVTAMADIGAIVGQMNEVSGSIAAAVDEQRATTQEIAASIQKVAESIAGTARAMEQVVSVSQNAGGISQQVLTGAGDIGEEARKLRVEVDQFLAAVRDETSEERRRYERVTVTGARVGVRVANAPPRRVELRNISRGGAAMACDWPLAPGTALEIELPDTNVWVAARVARGGRGELAVVFNADAAALRQIDQLLDTLTRTRRAA